MGSRAAFTNQLSSKSVSEHFRQQRLVRIRCDIHIDNWNVLYALPRSSL